MTGRQLVKSWSKQQNVTAPSSAEAETYALVCGSCEALGIAAYGVDLGVRFEIEALTDGQAALGIVQRTGIGQVRRIRTQALWLQELGREQRIQFHKVHGEENPADAMTTHSAEETLNKHLKKLNTKFEDGRSTLAPTFCTMDWLEDSQAGVVRNIDDEV